MRIEDFNSKSPLRRVTRARLVRSIIQDDTLSVTIESVEPIKFNLGDKIIANGRDYFLNLNPKIKKNHERNFVYDLTYEGISYSLRKIKLFNRDSLNRQTDFTFPLTTDLKGFLQLILTNANHKENLWELGNYEVDTDVKTISFNNQNCLSALQDVMVAYDAEFDFSKVGNKYVLNVGDLGQELPFSFEYGKGNGLYSLSRASVNDTEVVTRLYGFGSTENLPSNYRNFSQRLRMPASDYIENQALIDLFGYVEDIEEFDIKPSFEGSVTKVVKMLDTTVQFTCSEMDFDLKETDEYGTKYLIDGQPAQIHFNTGRLAGYDFDLHDYKHATKEFEIIKYEDERGLVIPDDLAFKLEAGDKFTITQIRMSQSYIDVAENKLLQEVQKRYDLVSKNNIKYVLETDPLFMRTKEVSLGDVATLKDAQLGVDKEIRIVKIEKDLLENGRVTLDLSDTYEVTLVKEILNEIHQISKRVDRTSVEVKRSYLNGYKRLKELQNSIFDTDGYFNGENIRPNSIETLMLSVGARSQMLNLEGVIWTANYQNDVSKIHVSVGRLVHFTIDNDNIREWSLSALTKSGLDTTSTYYVYAKCSRVGTTGTFDVTTQKRKFDSDTTNYFFQVAIIYKPIDGVRLINKTYGASFIQGNEITTGIIKSGNGRGYYDIDKGEISGTIKFVGSGKTAEDYIETEVSDARQNAIDASNAYADAQAEFERIRAEAYADGIVSDEEARAIQEAKDKLAEAKLYAEQQDLLLENVLENYTDGAIDKIEIGGENLLLKSDVIVTNSTYGMARYTYTEPIAEGEECTVTIWGELGSDRREFRLYNSGGNVNLAPLSKISEGVYRGSFRWKVGSSSNTYLMVYQFLRDNTTTSTINKIKLERGNKATGWSPAPEDIEQELQQARQNALDAQATANAVKEVTDWMDPTIIGGGGVVASGTMLVGNNAQGARAGISGLGTSGNSVRLWAGADFEGRATAPFAVYQDGTWKQHLANGALVRRTGLVNGDYVDEFYNSNGQLAKRTAIIDGKITEEWYNNGVLVMQIGQNGIYYVKEVAESWTRTELVDGGTGTTPNSASFHLKLCKGPMDIAWRNNADRVSWLYKAGQNPSSEINKQYEGYKTANGNRTSNIPNGWYVFRHAQVPVYPNGDAIITFNRILNGKVTETQTVTVPLSSILPCS